MLTFLGKLCMSSSVLDHQDVMDKIRKMMIGAHITSNIHPNSFIWKCKYSCKKLISFTDVA